MARSTRERVVENTPSSVPSTSDSSRPATTTCNVTPKPSQKGPMF